MVLCDHLLDTRDKLLEPLMAFSMRGVGSSTIVFAMRMNVLRDVGSALVRILDGGDKGLCAEVCVYYIVSSPSATFRAVYLTCVGARCHDEGRRRVVRAYRWASEVASSWLSTRSILYIGQGAKFDVP